MARRHVSPKQKGELRIVVQNAGRYALYWYANFFGEDLYCGPGAKFFQGARISHHASGKGHVHAGGQRHLAPVSTPPGRLVGKDRISGFSQDVGLLDWSYQPKRDAVHRKSLILDRPPLPLSVDLWILQPRRPELVQEVLQEYRQTRLLGQLHISVTSPELFAVAFTMTERGLASFARAALRDQPSHP
jgi:hypothetical protein